MDGRKDVYVCMYGDRPGCPSFHVAPQVPTRLTDGLGDGIMKGTQCHSQPKVAGPGGGLDGRRHRVLCLEAFLNSAASSGEDDLGILGSSPAQHGEGHIESISPRTFRPASIKSRAVQLLNNQGEGMRLSALCFCPVEKRMREDSPKHACTDRLSVLSNCLARSSSPHNRRSGVSSFWHPTF
jgi:hypothetical protein